jgi:hypothetical protein
LNATVERPQRSGGARWVTPVALVYGLAAILGLSGSGVVAFIHLVQHPPKGNPCAGPGDGLIFVYTLAAIGIGIVMGAPHLILAAFHNSSWSRRRPWFLGLSAIHGLLFTFYALLTTQGLLGLLAQGDAWTWEGFAWWLGLSTLAALHWTAIFVASRRD